MKTIKIEFQSNGQTIKKTAIVNDCLNELSNSKKNEAVDITNELWTDGEWSLIFEVEPGVQYEAVFKYDTENNQETLEPIKVITWTDDVIDDVQQMKVIIK